MGDHAVPRSMQARVRGLQWALEDFGDFLHRETLDLVEDDDGALVLVELVEQRAKLGPRLNLYVGRALLGFGNVTRWIRGRALATHVRASPVVGRDAKTDAV